MNEDETFMTMVDTGPVKHIIFHGSITRQNASNLVANLIGIDSDYKKGLSNDIVGFGKKEEDTTNKIVLHLNSTGGLVQSAFMVADTIESLTIPVDCILDGSIASASVIVMLACRYRAMQDHANIYVHDTIHSCDQLYYTEIKEFVAEQKKLYDKVIKYYVDKTDLKEKEVKQYFKEARTIDKDCAAKYGFINSTIKDIDS